MKNRRILLVLAALWLNVSAFSQSLLLYEDNKMRMENKADNTENTNTNFLFTSFGSGININFQEDKTSTQFDLSANTIDYEIDLRSKPDKKTDSLIGNRLLFTLINRAAISSDTIFYNPINYLGTRNGSPFTGRLSWNCRLGKEYEDVRNRFRISADARYIPYLDYENKRSRGLSSTFTASFIFQRKASVIDKESNGLFYFEPSFFIALNDKKINATIFKEREKYPYLLGAELFMGFIGKKLQENDFGIKAKWYWQGINGPNLQFGFSFSPTRN